MPDLKFLNTIDYLVVVVYMLMVVGIGVYMARFNKGTSDYFKGGGHIPWGLAAVSLFVSGFSAFMFVGAAGVTYKNGGGAIILFSLACPAYLLGYFLYGPLWRRTRIDTPMQFLNRRYSAGTTYFYTLMAVIPNVLILGIMIYTLCIFVSSAFGFNKTTFDLIVAQVDGFQLALLITGGVMLVYTLLGGLWAVMVTDALQFVILFLITLVMLPVAYTYLGDGSLIDGMTRLVREAPEGYFAINLEGQPKIFWIAYFTNIVLGYNVNWHIAQRYYSVPDERDTKKMALWCSALSLILPLLWILPVMAVPILFPDLNSLWPEFTDPSETAFVTLALAVLPHGMLGIMIAAIFAATMSSVDTTINWLAAVLTKDAYVPLRRRLRGQAPSDRAQLVFGKASVAIMGLFAIWMALNMEQYGGAFEVYLRADSLYKPSMFVPVILGLVYTRTPWWSGMAAFGAGVTAILIVDVLANRALGMPVDSFGSIFEQINITVLGIEMGRYELNTLVGVSVSALVFGGSAFFDKRTGDFATRIAALEQDLQTPAHETEAALDIRGLRAYFLAGRLAVIIGGLLLLLAIATADQEGTGLNVMVGLLAIALGVGIVWMAKRFGSGGA